MISAFVKISTKLECKIVNVFYQSIKICVFGAQKNHLIETYTFEIQ